MSSKKQKTPMTEIQRLANDEKFIEAVSILAVEIDPTEFTGLNYFDDNPKIELICTLFSADEKLVTHYIFAVFCKINMLGDLA